LFGAITETREDMILSEQQKAILQEILDLQGKCLDGKPRCQLCPLKTLCLPEFLKPLHPTQSQRFNLALRILLHSSLLDPEVTLEDILRDYNR
jgi:hypothetical protein